MKLRPLGAATDMAGAAHGGEQKPPIEAVARRKVVMAPKAPDFRR